MNDTARLTAGIRLSGPRDGARLDELDAALASVTSALGRAVVATAVELAPEYDGDEEWLEIVAGLEVAKAEVSSPPSEVGLEAVASLDEQARALSEETWGPLKRLFADEGSLDVEPGLWLVAPAGVSAQLVRGVPATRGSVHSPWEWHGPASLAPTDDDLGVHGTKVSEVAAISAFLVVDSLTAYGEAVYLVAGKRLDGVIGPSLDGLPPVLELLREGISAEGWRGVSPDATLTEIVEKLGTPTYFDDSPGQPGQRSLSYEHRLLLPDSDFDEYRFRQSFVSYGGAPVDTLRLSIEYQGVGEWAASFNEFVAEVRAHLAACFGDPSKQTRSASVWYPADGPIRTALLKRHSAEHLTLSLSSEQLTP